MCFNMSCFIPANPDVSGIGVRTAIYAQNLLSFIPAVYALADGKVDEQELDTIKDQSITILVTAFAILISTILQTQTYGLSGFHASVVLNLSWMNNTNVFIYFILYVHRRSVLDAGGKIPIWPAWSTWVYHVGRWLPERLHRVLSSLVGGRKSVAVPTRAPERTYGGMEEYELKEIPSRADEEAPSLRRRDTRGGNEDQRNRMAQRPRPST